MREVTLQTLGGGAAASMRVEESSAAPARSWEVREIRIVGGDGLLGGVNCRSSCRWVGIHRVSECCTRGQIEVEAEAENYRILLAKDAVVVDRTGKERERRKRERERRKKKTRVCKEQALIIKLPKQGERERTQRLVEDGCSRLAVASQECSVQQNASRGQISETPINGNI